MTLPEPSILTPSSVYNATTSMQSCEALYLTDAVFPSVSTEVTQKPSNDAPADAAAVAVRTFRGWVLTSDAAKTFMGSIA